MKRVFLAIALLVASLGAVEITVMGGGNYLIWSRPLDMEFISRTADGVGWHSGGLISIPVGSNLHLETGALFRHDSYVRSDGFACLFHLRFNTFDIPILLKTSIKTQGVLKPAFAGGPVLVHIHSGCGNCQDEEPVPVDDQFLGAALGLQARGELGIKILPCLFFKPSATLQFNLRPDYMYQQEKRWGKEVTFYLSLGLAFRL